MVVAVSWLGPASLHLGQDSLPSLMERILSYSKGKHQDLCLRTESQEKVGHAVRPQPENGYRRTELMFWSQILIQLKCCERTQASSSYEETHQHHRGLSGSGLRNGLKLLHVIVQNWSASTRNFSFSYCSKPGAETIHILLQHTSVTLDHFSQ